MGYQMPIVCKELYIPVLEDELSLQEYKERTGFDLSKFILLDIDNGEIHFNFPLYTKIYLISPYNGKNSTNDLPAVEMVNNYSYYIPWTEGNSDAETHLLFKDPSGDGYGIKFIIDSNSAFNIDNIMVTMLEL